MRDSHEESINCPIAEVFSFIADGENNSKWRSGVISIEKTSNDDVGLGSSYAQVLSGPGGRRIDGDYVITRFEKPTCIEFRVTAGPARPEGRFNLVPVNDSTTTVSFSLDLEPKGMMKLMSPMIKKQLRAETRQLSKLKEVLESAANH